MIYFDHAASTPITKEAFEILLESYREDFANPSSQYVLGRQLAKKLELTRESFKKWLHSSMKSQLVFLSSASEANNLLVRGLIQYKKWNDKEEIICAPGLHPSLSAPAFEYSDHLLVHQMKLNLHSTFEESLLNLISSKTRLLLISQVNNHSGHFFSSSELGMLAKKIREKNERVHIHLDASQSFSKHFLNVEESGVDSVSISAHKMGGPRGIAALWIRENINIAPQIVGGDHEGGLRASTQALPLIFSFFKASEVAFQRQSLDFERMKELNGFFCENLKKNCPEFYLPFEKDSCSPYIVLLLVPKIPSDVLLRLLEEKNIFVSSSSACSSKIKGHNLVFDTLGIASKLHKHVLRISFSSLNTQDEIMIFIQTLKEIIESHKKLF